MGLKLGSWGQSRALANSESELPTAERCLAQLAEGAAAGVAQVDAEGYRAFRSRVEGHVGPGCGTH